MKKYTFLLEIGLEELPHKNIKLLSESLLNNIKIEFNNNKIEYKEFFWFATPRRVAILINILNEYQNDFFIEKKGPKIDKIFNKDKNPTLLGIKWSKKNNFNLNEFDNYLSNDKKYLIIKKIIKGKLISSLLFNIVLKSLDKLSLIKKMYWGNKKILFIRPVHNIILLLNNKLIEGNILGKKIDKFSYGHRFMGEKKIIIDHAKIYKKKLLENGFVIVDFYERKEKIIKEIELNIKNLNCKINLENKILEEITFLVEWPVVLIGTFDKKYLSIPQKILKFIIEDKFKYITLYNKENNKIINNFILIVNIISKNPDKIIKDNEKVINSKLEDIIFFLKEDSKFKLEENILKLKNISFHKELGNYFDKILRIKILSSFIANKIGANIKNTMRSALLSKCDLITKMVFEFPEMQGIIGMYYALNNNENKIVSLAQKEQYQPRFYDDKLPTTKVSFSLAIADKIDTIVGIFIIGKYTKGYKDPFALRRLSLGIIRIIIENKLSISLSNLIEESIYLYNKNNIKNTIIINNIIDFIYGRLKSFYIDKGYNKCLIQEIFKNNFKKEKLINIDNKIILLIKLLKIKDFYLLLEIYKRIFNLLEKSKIIKFKKIKIEKKILKENEEVILYKNIEFVELKIFNLLKNNLYNEIIFLLKENFYIQINNFFKNIMILSENINLKENRLAILFKINKILLLLADFSLLKNINNINYLK